MFEDIYDIRRAKVEDSDEIMEFIKDEWKPDHILANSKEFFLYEFKDENYLNFIIAVNRSTYNIDGILGFLPASKDKDFLDIWGVMWKVSEKRSVLPFLGIELMRTLIKITKCRAEIGVGANPKTSNPLLKIMLGFWIGRMNHFYRISDKKKFAIAKITDRKFLNKSTATTYFFKNYQNINEVLDDFDFARRKSKMPYKDSWYYDKRYFNHPIYQYNVTGICNSLSLEVEAILVTREVFLNDSKVLRIVDFCGKQEVFSKLFNNFTELLSIYEYIDFYCYGFKKKYIQQAGFFERELNDKNVIPNYFEPFVKENVEIWINSSVEGCIFFKGDGDQDRPNYSVL